MSLNNKFNNTVEPPRRPPESAKSGLPRWLGKLHDFIMSIVPVGDGKWIVVNPTSAGRRIEFNYQPILEYLNSSVAAGSSENGAYPCVIIGGNNAAGYSVNIYANGFSQPSTGTGTLEAADLAWFDSLPAGARVIGHETTLTITGGSDI